ncbi:mechanosensitive ion channel domain-containing protein [Bosea sp. WAO]|uniref:mechanosensitive ion channel family protein n=1 Tax=Bosea sp. WAO TaxID=406341 RepID=UPI00082EDA93|nr:mechanosensitive ion channel domain-containing protein [Bosea sp. WAO]
MAAVRWFLLAMMALAFAGPAAAQTNAAPGEPLLLTLRGDETPETVRKLVDALSAGGRRVEVRIGGVPADVPAPAAVPAAPAGKAATAPKPAPAPSAVETADSQAEALADYFVSGLDYGRAAIPSVRFLPSDWLRSWSLNRNASPTTRLLASLALALGIALLFRFATARWFAARMRPRAEYFTARLIASGFGLLQDMLTIVLGLVVARLAGSYWLPSDDLAAHALHGITNGTAVGATYVATGRFLLAPGQPERRLMPLPRAERHFRLLCTYAVLVPVFIVAALLAHRVSGGPEPVAGLVTLSGFVLAAYKIWWFVDARYDLTALVLSGSAEPGPGRRFLALAMPWIYVAIAVLLWMVGRAAAMMPNGGRWSEAAELTQIIVVLAPILSVGVNSLLTCRQARRAAIARPTPLAQALGHAVRAAAGGVMWAGGFYLVARIWAGLLFGMSSGQFGQISRQIASIAVLAFAGWVVMVFLRGFFDAYAPRPRSTGPVDEDVMPEDNIPSRLATVMPVLRGVVLTAVIGLTILVLLSRLGVDIGPLLAGFGILGLAISFGSQALVRDIVSGFFFMLEDAFRVGEYVDTGRLKGTVEKISLRSMQLRHQSGQIHTVPFGQVQSLTNASRDWATVKFNVRLDHSADIEKARKTIKKVGLALLEDPEFGPHFIAQLKMQGVADITDAAIVIRLKFTSKPTQASMLQREALKRVYRGLIEAEVPFASTAVTVREGGGKGAAGAAAITAVAPPSPLAPAAE